MQKYLLIILLIIFSVVVSCPADNPKPDDMEIPLFIPPDFAGICHSGYSGNPEREYEMLGELGAVWLHRDFSWSTIQPSEDTRNFLGFDTYVERGNAENKKIMGMLLYDVNWVHDKFGFSRERRIREEQLPYYINYAVETVKRYNGKPGSMGRVDAWLIWNEPDLDRFWKGTKEEFYTLTRETAAAIRDLDAEEGTATVLIGGVFSPLASDDWINGLFKSGAMEQVDCVAYHPYSFAPAGAVNVFNNFRKKIKPYGFADKIWVNEMGYPTFPDKGMIPPGRYGTDQYEGDMPEVAVKTFTLLASAGAKNLTWYHLFDGASRDNADSEAWFGLVWRQNDDNWTRKGGYWGYSLCAKNIPGKTYIDKSFFTGSVPSNIDSYYFEGNGTNHTLVVWNNSPLRSAEVTISLNGNNHTLWDPETGESVSIESTSSHTLYPINTYQKTLVFLTWQDQ